MGRGLLRPALDAPDPPRYRARGSSLTERTAARAWTCGRDIPRRAGATRAGVVARSLPGRTALRTRDRRDETSQADRGIDDRRRRGRTGSGRFEFARSSANEEITFVATRSSTA